jgi:hypothetical protein
MNILFLHPEDQPDHRTWAKERWDRVIDLGIGGAQTYKGWAEFFGCKVDDLGFARTNYVSIQKALGHLAGRLYDRYRIDWWGVISTYYIQQLFRVAALQNLVEDIRCQDKVFCSRCCFERDVLEVLLAKSVPSLSGQSFVSRLKATAEKARRLSFQQARQVIWDKYDPGHHVRARFVRSRALSDTPVVLLPTAYLNTTRMALAHARSIPDCQFLLVSARQSGYSRELPANTIQADLAAYNQQDFDRDEYFTLSELWEMLRPELEAEPLLQVLMKTGGLESFSNSLRQWLRIRDAWINIFKTERIVAVLSCDDNNPYTAIPLLLARHLSLPAVACHHGALDGHRLIKSSPADVLLAKGPMEQDYLTNVCGVQGERVETGAPVRPSLYAHDQESKPCIIFFSEDYEVSGGRVEEFYRDILPPLIRLAREGSKKLVIKLHPAESLHDRRRIVKSVLSKDDMRIVQVVDGLLTEELMSKARFAVTVISTAAVDCALRSIPVFLCGWLENWPLRYSEQFAKFRVGARLSSPAELKRIPELLNNYAVCDPAELWQPMQAQVMRVLFSDIHGGLAAAV